MSMINCPDCGKEMSPSATKCPNCGRPGDVVSGGLCFVSFILPLFGIIYGLSERSLFPRRGNACLRAAIVSIVLFLAIPILFVIFSIVAVFSI